jgi:hypothetical protein
MASLHFSSRATVLVLTSLAATLLLCPAADAKKRRGLHYGGVTDQGAPVVLDLARGGKRGQHVAITVGGTCSDGARVSYNANLSFQRGIPPFVPDGQHILRTFKLSKRGAFRTAGLGSEVFGDSPALMNERLSGRVQRTGAASGTYSAEVNMAATGVKCTVPPVRWTARSARAQVFTGATSQGHPLVVELDSTRRTVAHLRYSWTANCTPEGSGGFLIPEDVSNLPLAGADFSHTEQQPFAVPDGIKRTFDYVQGGHITGTSANGTLSVKVTDADAAGTPTSTCDTGPLTWSATSG